MEETFQKNEHDIKDIEQTKKSFFKEEIREKLSNKVFPNKSQIKKRT